jgi:flagellar biosynthesis/type III secretory pathway M-ring protein FliF/YscJ
VDPVALVLIFLVLLGAVALVTAPLRRGREEAHDARDEARREELEAAKEAKYREIRDAEMDFRTGKLSEQDYRALDAELRAEALRVLDALAELGERPAAATGGEEAGEAG